MKYCVFIDSKKATNDPMRISITSDRSDKTILGEFDDFSKAYEHLLLLRSRIEASQEGIMDDSAESYKLDFSSDGESPETYRKKSSDKSFAEPLMEMSGKPTGKVPGKEQRKETKILIEKPLEGYDENYDSKTEEWRDEPYAVMRKLDGKPGDPDYITIMSNDLRPAEGWVAENSIETLFTDLEWEEDVNLIPKRTYETRQASYVYSLVVADDPLSLPADEAYTVISPGAHVGTKTAKGTVIATCEFQSCIEMVQKAVTEVWRMRRPRNSAPEHPEIMRDEFSFLDLSDDRFRNAMIDARRFDPECPITVIAGSGGSGKSEIYKAVYADDPHHTLALALTGFAADTLRDSGVKTCTTINKGLGIAPRDFYTPELELFDLARTIGCWDTILIDEVSMASINMMDMLMRHLAKANRLRGEKGPVKLILFGDPLQLLPVITERVRPTFSKVYGKDVLFFNAPAFRAMKRKTHILHKSHRQKDDPVLSGILYRMRTGCSTDEDVATLNEHVKEYDRLSKDTGVEAIRVLACDNDTVDLYNRRMSARMNRDKKFRVVHRKEYMIEAFDHRPKTPVYPEEIVLHSGDPVIILENDRWHRGDKSEYSNGSTGVIKGFSYQGLPVVKMMGGNEVVVRRTTVSRNNEKFVQLACKLAYAVTYHKAQGLTLRQVYLDLGNKMSDMQEDMVYLGLSRVRTLDGLGLSRPLKKKELTDSLNAEAVEYFAMEDGERDRIVPCSMKFLGCSHSIDEEIDGVESRPNYRKRNSNWKVSDSKEDK